VQDSAQFFSPGPVDVVKVDDTTYDARVAIPASAPPGNYTGSLALAVCEDSACTKRYAVSGAAVSYSVNVAAQLEVEVYAGTEKLASVLSGNEQVTVTAPCNAPLEFRTNVPTTWTWANYGQRFFPIMTVDPASTATVLRATFTDRTLSQLGDSSRLSGRATDATSSFQHDVVLYVDIPPRSCTE
jgi:hypothetical protein